MLSLASALPTGQRRALVGAFWLTLAIIAFATIHTVSGVGGSGLDVPIRDWATAAVYVLVALIVVTARGPGRASRAPPGS